MSIDALWTPEGTLILFPLTLRKITLLIVASPIFLLPATGFPYDRVPCQLPLSVPRTAASSASTLLSQDVFLLTSFPGRTTSFPFPGFPSILRTVEFECQRSNKRKLFNRTDLRAGWNRTQTSTFLFIKTTLFLKFTARNAWIFSIPLLGS